MSTKSAPYKIRVYRDKNLQWRWNMSRKGRIIADSAEAYTRLHGCMSALRSMSNDLFTDGGFKVSAVTPADKEAVAKWLSTHLATHLH